MSSSNYEIPPRFRKNFSSSCRNSSFKSNLQEKYHEVPSQSDFEPCPPFDLSYNWTDFSVNPQCPNVPPWESLNLMENQKWNCHERITDTSHPSPFSVVPQNTYFPQRKSHHIYPFSQRKRYPTHRKPVLDNSVQSHPHVPGTFVSKEHFSNRQSFRDYSNPHHKQNYDASHHTDLKQKEHFRKSDSKLMSTRTKDEERYFNSCKSGKRSSDCISGSSTKSATKETSPKDNVNKNNASERETHLLIRVSDKVNDLTFWKNYFKECFKHEEFLLEKHDESDVYNVKFKSLQKTKKAMKILNKKSKKECSFTPKVLHMSKNGTTGFSCNSSSSLYLNSKTDKLINSCKNYILEKKELYLKMFRKQILEAQSELRCLESKIDDTKDIKALKMKLFGLEKKKIVFVKHSKLVLSILNELDGLSFKQCVQKIGDIKKDYARECGSFITGFPVYACKDAIISMVSQNQVCVLTAETGSGKSTQIAQYLWREGLSEKGMIVCTQPKINTVQAIVKYVSGQIGDVIGGIVGYKVGWSVKKSSKTKILYMTDSILLEEVLNDPLLSNISCIIIDEAHERSLHTDLLFGLIKDCLHYRNDLRVLITSATIDPNIFVKYFNLNGNTVLSISGNLYPIKENWKKENVKLGWDYLSEAVDLAFKIHITEKPGDVLIFLATPDETEEAVAMLSSKLKHENFENIPAIYSFHGKQNKKEYLKCISAGGDETRKIIFATNFAETSYTIPGLKYVIDCGVAKELKYCPERNTNELVVRFISKCSAEQRKGRVGRTCEGICYRLYSKENFINMPDEAVPEILQVNLRRALLILFALGIKDPHTFPFITPPSSAALKFAMESLIQLGVIANNSLTPLGHKMVKIPLDPRLSKIIFQGIDEEIGYISIVTAAAASTSEKIFQKDRLNTKKVDEKKQKFYHNGGDYITFLTVFREWLKIAFKRRFYWCKENYINFRGMLIIIKTIAELKEILSKEFSFSIRRYFPDNPSAFVKLQKIIFHCFADNLCVYSHDGYVSPYLPFSVSIHPFSSLRYTRRHPKYLVYDTVLETSKVYLLNVTPVSEEMIKEAAEMNIVSSDLINNVILQPVFIHSVGETIMLRDLLGQGGCKVKLLEEKIKELTNNIQSHVKLNPLTGDIAIYTPPKFHKLAKDEIKKVIELSKMKMLAEEEVVSLFDISSIRATVGCGAIIKSISLPGDFTEISVEISHGDFSIKCISEQLKKCGEMQKFEVLSKEKQKNFQVSFTTVSHAKKALEFLESYNIKVEPVLKQTYRSSSAVPVYQIKVNWPRRFCSGSAAVTFISTEDFLEASHILSSVHFSIQGSLVEVSAKKSGELLLQNLPQCITEEEIYKIICEYLPSKGVKRVKLQLQTPFVSSLSEIRRNEKQMFQVFGQFTSTEKLRVEVTKPRCVDIEWTAHVYFENTADGEKAFKSLSGKKLGAYSLRLKPILQTTLKCSMAYFSAVKDRVQTAILSLADQIKLNSNHLEIDLKTISDGSYLLITITSSNSQDMASARHSFGEILKGDQIECINDDRRKNLFHSYGQKFLKSLSKRTDTYIHLDFRKKIISIFGSKKACLVVRNEIESYLNMLETENVKEVFLSDSNRPRGLLQEFARTYECNLQEFENLCGLSSVEFCATKHKLILKGKKEALEKAEKHLNEIGDQLHKHRMQADDEKRLCSICLGVLSITSYRLEYCGHIFCRDCLGLQLEARVIPLLCPEEGCEKPFVVEDIKKLLIGKKHLSSPLYEEAFRQFVQKDNELCYCPTPDCSMVHRITTSSYPTYCPICKNDICTQCKSIYHHGMRCNEYQLMKNSEKCIKVWLDGDCINRKLCTKCFSPIEKNGGCDHMTCLTCGSHFCWLCMEVFARPELVYSHLPNCPFNNN